MKITRPEIKTNTVNEMNNNQILQRKKYDELEDIAKQKLCKMKQ